MRTSYSDIGPESYAIKIIEVFRTFGDMTMEEATALHGDMGLDASRLRAEYTKLLTRKLLVRSEEFLIITRAGERVAENLQIKKQRSNLQIAAPRAAPTVRPLDKKHMISAIGGRPGSNEYRDWPSVHIPFKK